MAHRDLLSPHGRILLSAERLLKGKGLALIAFITSLIVSYLIVSRLGVPALVMVLFGAVSFIILMMLAMRDMSWLVISWLFTMIGFRGLVMVRMPGLPDFSFDRLFLVLVVLFFLLMLVLGRKSLRPPYGPEIILLIHMIYILVQLTVTGTHHLNTWTLSNFTPFFAFLYGKYIMTEEKSIRNLLIFLMVVNAYYFITAIGEQYSLKALVFPPQIADPEFGHLWQPGRSRGPVMHPPLFGQLMGMFLLINFFFLTRRTSRIWKLILWLSLGGGSLGLLFAYTRAPWVATILSVILLVVLRRSYRRVVAVLMVIGVLAGIVGVVQMANSDFLQERMETTNTIENRLSFLGTAFSMLKDRPLFGVGYFKYMEVKPDYERSIYFPFYGYVNREMGENVPPHDIYLGRFAEEGLISVGLLAIFSLYVLKSLLIHLRSKVNGEWFNKDTVALFAAIMACYHIGGMFIDYRYFDFVNVAFFMVAGIVVGYRPK